MFQIETPPSVPDHDLIGRLMDLYIQCKEMKGTLTEEWKRNYRITMNRSAPAVPSAPGTRANEVFATVSARIGWMTDQEVEFSITPACDPYSLWSITTQTLGEQLEQVLNSVMKTNGWYAEIEKMLWDADLYGPGFLKATWDAGLESGMGDVALKHVSPWCLYIDPFATNLDDAQYIFEVHSMTPSEIERRFPTVAHSTIDRVARSGDTDTDHLPPDQRQSRVKSGVLIPVDAGQGPTSWGQPGSTRTHTYSHPRAVNVYECWIRENYEEWIKPTYPSEGDVERRVITVQWRVIVFSGDRVLLDEISENLYHTNRHPYVRYVAEETGELWGTPILRDLAPCQQAMNTLLAMAQNNITFTGNPIMIGVKGSGVDRSTFLNRPGMIYDVNNSGGQAQANKPSWLNPPELPQSVLALITLWREEIERIGGISATQRGEVPSGRATDRQVQAGQEAGFVRIRTAQRNLELALRKAGELLANLVIINYDTSRFVAIVGEEGETSSIRLSAQHFYAPTEDYSGEVKFEPLRFVMQVNAGSSKPTSRAARMQEAVQLKQMNVVDDQFVLQSFRVPHWKQVYERKLQQEQMQLQLAQAQREAGQQHAAGSQKRPASTAPRPA